MRFTVTKEKLIATLGEFQAKFHSIDSREVPNKITFNGEPVEEEKKKTVSHDRIKLATNTFLQPKPSEERCEEDVGYNGEEEMVCNNILPCEPHSPSKKNYE